MDKRLIKARRATRLVIMERDVLATANSLFITGLMYAFHNKQVRFDCGWGSEMCVLWRWGG